MLTEYDCFNAGIVGLGTYLPERRITEHDFIKAGVPKEKIDEWGIYEHRVSEPDETPSDMSIKAAKDLIKNTGLNVEEIDLIIDCAFIPDYIHPGNSHKIQTGIGAINAATIDVVPSSGGIIPQLIIANSLILTKAYRKILITCSCKYTAVSDKTDWFSFVLAGDGAAAALVSRVEGNKGMLSSYMLSKGEFFQNSGIKMKLPKNSNSMNTVYEDNDKKLLFFIENANIFLNNQDKHEEFLDNFIHNSVPMSAKVALEKINMSYDDVNFWITHQNANVLRDCWIEALGIKNKGNYYYSNSKYGNLYNANVLVNLKEAVDKEYIKDGDIVVLGCLSAGFSTGSVVMRWGQ